MNKYDWLCNGIRLMGLYWLVQGMSGSGTIFYLSSLAGAGQLGGRGLAPLLGSLLTVLTGVGLFLFAPSVVGWLARRDARGEPTS